MAGLAPDADAMASAFHKTLDDLVGQCFVWKRVRRKSNSTPWVTDGLRSLMKKRMSIFKQEGRSQRWRRIDSSIKNTLEVRKAKHFTDESDRLKSIGRESQWYSILSKMLDEDSPKQWSITELEPDTPPEELAEKTVTAFQQHN